MDHGEQFFNSSGGGGVSEYQIQRSLRFNSADSASLSRTPSVAGNRKTWTWAGWVKRSGLSSYSMLFSGGITASDSGETCIYFDVSNGLSVSGGSTVFRTTSAVFRDPSAWYHVVVSWDTSQATASDRVKIYVNGLQLTAFSTSVDPSLNLDGGINTTTLHTIGSQSRGIPYYFDGYLADVHFIDGQALDPTSFGEFDANGVWQPKAYTGTYGTNGFHLPFSDNSTSAALGTDTSGAGNNWTVNNISVAAGAGNDSLVDTPTNYGTDTGLGGEVRGNYATFNPLYNYASTLSNGNLDWSAATVYGQTAATLAVSSGKWYWEVVVVNAGLVLGIKDTSTGFGASWTGMRTYYSVDGNKYTDASAVSYGSAFTNGDVIGCALDLDAGTLTFYKNNVSQGTAFTGLTGSWYPCFVGANSGDTRAATINFGQRPFAYTAPSGFKALCTTNLPEPTIADGSTVMDVKLYTGTGSSQSITGLGFSPDLAWIKPRSSANSHQLFDTVRGDNKVIYSNNTNAEENLPNTVSFDSNGITIGTSNNLGVLDRTYVAWTWDAGSSTVTNNDGSITSQVRANPSAGFSIVSYTPSSSVQNATVGHGLSVAPKLIIFKNRSTTSNWIVTTTVIDGSNDYLLLQSTASASNAAPNAPTSSVFYVWDNADTGLGSNSFVAYCFAPVAGYSSFGSVTGNGSADGPFIYLGFRPKFFMYKRVDAATDWWIDDGVRNTYNVVDRTLYPNLSAAEVTSNFFDFTANGVKVRDRTDANTNANGGTYIYAAFAENPFKTARAR